MLCGVVLLLPITPSSCIFCERSFESGSPGQVEVVSPFAKNDLNFYGTQQEPLYRGIQSNHVMSEIFRMPDKPIRKDDGAYVKGLRATTTLMACRHLLLRIAEWSNRQRSRTPLITATTNEHELLTHIMFACPFIISCSPPSPSHVHKL